MDVGAMYHGYSADVTRTFPANGKFSDEQKAIYQSARPQSIQNNKIPFEEEVLTPVQRLNEYMMTSLRTIWGCDLTKLKSEFDETLTTQFFKRLEKIYDPGLRDRRTNNLRPA